MTVTIHPVFPSILTSNYFDLESRLQQFDASGIDFIHLDIMDGHFVPNLSFGPSASKAIKSQFDLRIDSHLMVSDPEKMVPWFIAAGSDWISFHVEAAGNHPGKINEIIAMIHKENRGAGLVLSPGSPVEQVFPYLGNIEFVLLMSVFPGYGGQKFITATIDRVAALKQQIQNTGVNCLIQVDGGVNLGNIGALKKAGTDLFVIGTFLFNAEDIPTTLENIDKQLNPE